MQAQEEQEEEEVVVDPDRAREGLREAMITVLAAAAVVVVVVVVEETTLLNRYLPPSQECSVMNVRCIDFMGTFLRMFGRQCTRISVKQRVASCSAQVTHDRLLSHHAILLYLRLIIY